MKLLTNTLVAVLIICGGTAFAQDDLSSYNKKVMDGFPPTAESQVTFGNYRNYPFSEWAFRNAGAPLNVVMIPRAGEIYTLKENYDSRIGKIELKDANGENKTVDKILEECHTDGFLVLKGNELMYERYFNGLTKDYQHIWFSATKSLTSTAFGILVDQGKANLNDSPAKYIPELKGSGFERVTIQNVLDHSTSIDFKENYTDPNSDFLKYYGPAMNMAQIPGGRDAKPESTEIYGVYDFISKFIRPDTNEIAGEVFDYNSANSDLLGWLISRISGMSYDQFIQQNIWAKLGTDHDAYIAVDRAYMGIATGGFNSTLRDAAHFGSMILNRGNFNGQQIVSAAWVDATINLTAKDKAKMNNNTRYAGSQWIAYKNMWWVLDEQKGEYAAVGIHGQVIYINRKAGIVIAFFSSQPVASAAGNSVFWSKILACQKIASEIK
ncbi:serine hydrolase [Lentimicrobium sp. S6]|uniref:serine hydrolase domain-containing protein n=1 Tax=Lentimicrobium sp. S6 TaxID=2735872 RepID=UPI00155356A7|nr:serine hydrolase [Lentimicrobium sp. S6]NPD48133.1 serine hydrolase [Lentimicrobium sp. S6]